MKNFNLIFTQKMGRSPMEGRELQNKICETVSSSSGKKKKLEMTGKLYLKNLFVSKLSWVFF